MYFNQEIRSVAESDKPVNMHIINDPDFELDFEQSLKQVETIFKAIYPDEEFIPTVPHPEDIIWVIIIDNIFKEYNTHNECMLTIN